MEINVITKVESFRTLKEEWNSLLGRSLNNTLFLSWEWMYRWHENMGGKTEKPFIIIVKNREQIVGIAPLALVNRRFIGKQLQFMGQQYSYHLGFIAERGQEESVCNAIWSFLLNQAIGKFRSIDFIHLEEDTVFEDTFRKKVNQQNLILEKSIYDPCQVVYLPDSFEEYLDSIKKVSSFGNRLKYCLRRLERDFDVEFFFADKNNLHNYWSAFLKLHYQRMAEKDASSALLMPNFANFYLSVAKSFLKKQALRLAVLKLNGEIAAVMLGIVYNKSFNALNIGFSPQISKANRWLSLCPVNLALCIRTAIESGLDEFDFLGGQLEYKEKMGTQDSGGMRILIYKSKQDMLRAKKLMTIKTTMKQFMQRRIGVSFEKYLHKIWSILSREM